MKISRLGLGLSRRNFIQNVLPGGVLLCLGGHCLFASSQFEDKAKSAGQKHKFLEDSGMSFSDVFKFAFTGPLPLMRGLEREMGRDKFFEMLKRLTSENAKKEASEMAKKLGKEDLATYTQDIRKPNRFWQHVLTFQIVEDTPKAFEVKITECLWAKTFRDANSGDIGYLLSCYGDYASAEGFNPKMRLIRTKTLMQGHDFCNHRYVLEA